MDVPPWLFPPKSFPPNVLPPVIGGRGRSGTFWPSGFSSEPLRQSVAKLPRVVTGTDAGARAAISRGIKEKRGTARCCQPSYCLGWQEWRDSNPQPPVLETGALAIELHSYAAGYIAGRIAAVTCRPVRPPLFRAQDRLHRLDHVRRRGKGVGIDPAHLLGAGGLDGQALLLDLGQEGRVARGSGERGAQLIAAAPAACWAAPGSAGRASA